VFVEVAVIVTGTEVGTSVGGCACGVQEVRMKMERRKRINCFIMIG
jgi:hypothetical protein